MIAKNTLAKRITVCERIEAAAEEHRSLRVAHDIGRHLQHVTNAKFAASRNQQNHIASWITSLELTLVSLVGNQLALNRFRVLSRTHSLGSVINLDDKVVAATISNQLERTVRVDEPRITLDPHRVLSRELLHHHAVLHRRRKQVRQKLTLTPCEPPEGIWEVDFEPLQKPDGDSGVFVGGC